MATTYRIYIMCVTQYVDEDGTTIEDCVYWDDGEDTHPFERRFDSREEAFAYARTFTPDMAMEAHRTGIGPQYQGISCDVVECEEVDGEIESSEAVLMRVWSHMDTLGTEFFEEVEFDENGMQV